MDKKIMRIVAREFSELDFSVENVEVERIKEKIADVETAIERAEGRCTEIARLKDSYRGPSGRDVADALLANQSATVAATAFPDPAALEAERVALRAAIRELQHQAEDLRAEISRVEMACRHRLREPSEQLAAMIIAEAATLGEQLLQLYAAAAAVMATTRYGQAQLDAMREAAQGLAGPDGLCAGRRSIDVPSEITDLLQNLNGKGPALTVGFINSAGV